MGDKGKLGFQREKRRCDMSKSTKEVSLKLSLNIDGRGERNIKTGVGFLDHMLEIFCEFSLFDLTLSARGDTHIDFHHTVEEVGKSLGEAIRRSCGDDIERFADSRVPLDEALCEFTLDISGRPYFFLHGAEKIQDIYLRDLLFVFFDGMARGGGFTIHCSVLHGMNSHHIVEACFKAGALCFRRATRTRGLEKPSSTKGYL